GVDPTPWSATVEVLEDAQLPWIANVVLDCVVRSATGCLSASCRHRNHAEAPPHETPKLAGDGTNDA
ncbi:MAG: hypothetical protein ACXVP7_13240, partial [Actinomycetota bacterium]